MSGPSKEPKGLPPLHYLTLQSPQGGGESDGGSDSGTPEIQPLTTTLLPSYTPARRAGRTENPIWHPGWLATLTDELYARIFEFIATPGSEPLAVCKWFMDVCLAHLRGRAGGPLLLPSVGLNPCPDIPEEAWRSALIAFGPPIKIAKLPPGLKSWREVFFKLCNAFSETWWINVHLVLSGINSAHPEARKSHMHMLHMTSDTHVVLRSGEGAGKGCSGAGLLWKVGTVPRGEATGQTWMLQPADKRRFDYIYQMTLKDRPSSSHTDDDETEDEDEDEGEEYKGPLTSKETFFWYLDQMRVDMGFGAEPHVTTEGYLHIDIRLHSTLMNLLRRTGDSTKLRNLALELLKGNANVWFAPLEPEEGAHLVFWNGAISSQVETWLGKLNQRVLVDKHAGPTAMQLGLMTQDVELVAEMLKRAPLPRPQWRDNDIPALAVFSMSEENFEKRVECVVSMLSIILVGVQARNRLLADAKKAKSWRPVNRNSIYARRADLQLDACVHFANALSSLVTNDEMERHLQPVLQLAMQARLDQPSSLR